MSSAEATLSLEIPTLGPGTRVDVLVGKTTLACRAASMQGQGLHLMVSESSVRHAAHCTPGQSVRMTMYRSGTCWEFIGTIREWIWTQPAVLVVGALQGWQEKQRRQDKRDQRSLEAQLSLETGARYCGQTLDLSANGLSILLPMNELLNIGSRGHVTLRLAEDDWCADMPISIARLENWLHKRGRLQRVGASLVEPLTPEQRNRWDTCLTRLSEPDSGELKAA